MSLHDFLTKHVVTVLPKKCFIVNWRLGLLFWSLRVACMSWCFYTMWTNNALLSQVNPRGSRSFWSIISKEAYAKAQEADRNESFCTDPTKFDYLYDATGAYDYTNAECYDMRPDARWIKEEHGLYIPSYFQEFITSVKAGTAPASSTRNCTNACTSVPNCSAGSFVQNGAINELGKCMCECTQVRNRFVTAVEENIIEFQHLVHVQNRFTTGLGAGTDDIEISSATKSSTDGQLLLTVVRDADTKEVYREFQPGELISLRLSEMLKFAKVLLNGDMNRTLPNYLKNGKARKYPPRRMTGGHIEISLSYHNLPDKNHPKDKEYDVCFMEIRYTDAWVSKPILDQSELINVESQEGSFRYRYHYGIAVSFVVTGSYSFLDINKIFTAIATLVVYWSMPTAIVTFLAQRCLGRLSNIYKGASMEPIQPSKLFHSMLLRSVAALHLYRSMHASWHGGEENAGSQAQIAASVDDSGSTNSCMRADEEEPTMDQPNGRDEKSNAEDRQTGRWNGAGEGNKNVGDSLKKGNNAEGEEADELEHARILADLRELFECTNNCEDLDDAEYRTLQRLMCNGLPTLKKEDFINGYMATDPCSLEICAQMYDITRRRGIMESLLKDSEIIDHCRKRRSIVDAKSALPDTE
eukprot:TRINITY_DN2010_c0_g1_i1.p1 TRINITY_DN2010_c0_g1~~TRINITY_DN2010_c0_g1_i1.p1  ORF type:complete len:655 (+),score=50.56 TRINITY_DN2010_c0_g1_i1:49-1965(+)